MEPSKLAHGYAKSLKLSPGLENLDSRMLPMEKIEGLRVSSPLPSSLLLSLPLCPARLTFPACPLTSQREIVQLRYQSLLVIDWVSLPCSSFKGGGEEAMSKLILAHRAASSRCPPPHFLEQSQFVAEYLPSFINAVVFYSRRLGLLQRG